MKSVQALPQRDTSSVGWPRSIKRFSALGLVLATLLTLMAPLHAAELRAGAARADITERDTVPVHDPLYAKALVLKSDSSTAVVITLDAVSVGEIGRIGNGFLASVRAELQRDLGIAPESVFINASHCHGVVRADTLQLTVQAVKEAWRNLAPARAAATSGTEGGISENRRLKLIDGTEVDMRRAYPLPPDAAVASVGPIDPQIGILRLDREDGRPLAVLYNFACHPIMNPPSTGNTADFPGYASKVIEEELGQGALAFFVQGCGGDINPVGYKIPTRRPSAEPLGTKLGLSVMREARKLVTTSGPVLKSVSRTLALPRNADFARRIAANEAEQLKLVRSLRSTNLDFKAFLPLYVQHRLAPEMPSGHVQNYLRQKAEGKEDLLRMDADNGAALSAYVENIHTMEQLTRLNTNLALLKRHQAQTEAAGTSTLEVEVGGLRVGDFRLVTFPGELSVEVGLNIKRAASLPHGFVAGYTNGYIYYTSTAAQLGNKGYAQEDCDTLVAPEWQKLFEDAAVEMLKSL